MSLSFLPAADRIVNRISACINTIPIDLPLEGWINTVRTLLTEQFSDIDRISICLNVNCPLEAPEGHSPRIHIAEHPLEKTTRGPLVGIAPRDETPGANILADFRRLGLPMERYHEPVVIEYRYRGTAYLGTMFLWRDRERESISSHSIEMIRDLEEFFVMAFSHAILCNRLQNPAEVIVHREIANISSKHGLTVQEQRVITYRLLGQSLKEIADAMNIREDSAKKLAQKVYRKCDCNNHVEFIARFITPRMFGSVISVK